jgi:hypothetical protein
MKYATIIYRHPEGWPQSLGRAFAEHDVVTPVALHSSRLLDDGTAVMLYELEGDLATIREILTHNGLTTDYRVTQYRDCIIAYIHYNPTTTVKRLLRIPTTYGLVVDSPMMFHEDGGLEITLIGFKGDIREALAETPDILTTTVERVGSYEPGAQGLFAKLSERQREVLQTAHELGYYQQPRRATHQEVASELDCTAANVGDILRRIENTLVNEIVRSAFGTKHETPPFRSVW